MGTVLNAAAILEADDRKTKTVNVPEWGGDVTIRELSGTDRDALEAAAVIRRGDRVEPNPIGTRARLVAKGLVNEDGSRVFTDAQAMKLSEKNGAVLDRLFDEIVALSGMGAGAVADAEGNSEADPSESSTSD